MRDWLKEARTRKGLTQLQVAEALDVTESFYSFIEKGQRVRRMTIPMACELSKILGIPLEKIIEQEGLPENPPQRSVSPQGDRMLYDRIKALCDERRISIAKLEQECGLGNATVKGWREADPRSSKLKAVADYLGVTVDYLLAP